MSFLDSIDKYSTLLTALASVVLVIVTGWYTHLTHLAVDKTEKMIQQSRNEQKIELIEKRLEKLYDPLIIVLSSRIPVCSTEENIPINGDENNIGNADINKHPIDEIYRYQYLIPERNNLKQSLDLFLKMMDATKGRTKKVEIGKEEIVSFFKKFREDIIQDIEKSREELYELIQQ